MFVSFSVINMFVSVYKLDSYPNENPICVLNEGEHVIGRGDLIGCTDKRASRTHALIKVSNGSATITATHQNPCFFQSAGSKTVIILAKDIPSMLQEGDKFGIFPDQYWFRVKFGEENLGNKMTESNENVIDYNATTSHKRMLNEDDSNSSPNKISKTDETVNSHPNEIVALLQFNPFEEEKVRRILEICAENKDRTIKEQLSVSEPENNESVGTSENNTEKQNSIASKAKKEELSSSEHEDNGNEIEEQPNNVSNTETESNEVEVAKSPKDVEKLSPDPDEPSSSGANGDNTNSENKVRRDRCWYGQNCYRKSFHHKKDFSHPDDSDYDSDPNDVRPVCGYGADCYRKNKDHRKEYKHPRTDRQPPKRQGKKKRKAAAKKPKAANDESSEDDYDYNDPFNDDEFSEDEYKEESWSESDSDEDWEPSNNADDQDGEDTKALIKEAKRFTKRK